MPEDETEIAEIIDELPPKTEGETETRDPVQLTEDRVREIVTEALETAVILVEELPKETAETLEHGAENIADETEHVTEEVADKVRDEHNDAKPPPTYRGRAAKTLFRPKRGS